MRKSFVLRHFGEQASRWMLRMPIVFLALLALECLPMAAQSGSRPEDLTPEDIVLPTASANRLAVKFILPFADTVSSFEVSAGGVPIDKDKVSFTAAEKLQDFRCAVLLLVDKALATTPSVEKSTREKLPDLSESVRGAVRRLIPAANGPIQFGIATYSATNVVVLAAIQAGNKTFLDQAVSSKYLKFDSANPDLLYHGAKEAISNVLGKIQADRKFLVIISDGISKDTVDSEADVLKAAHDAKVHICTIGFPKSLSEAPQLEKLARLADQTGGLSWSAEGHALNLPAEWDSNLLKFMLSGGRGEVNLAGRTAPLHLEFKVKTNADRVLSFTYTLESMPSAPSSPLPTPAASAKPASMATATPSTALTPETILGWLKAGLEGHLSLAIGIGVALLIALVLTLGLIFRGTKKAKADLDDDVTAVNSKFPPPREEVTNVPQPVAPVMAWLVTLDADSTRHPISKTALRIGRKQDNDLVMKNDSVSSHHAEILKRGDKFIIADLGASNGVFVKGKRIEKTPLENGDIIELGEVRLRFTLNQSEE